MVASSANCRFLNSISRSASLTLAGICAAVVGSAGAATTIGPTVDICVERKKPSFGDQAPDVHSARLKDRCKQSRRRGGQGKNGVDSCIMKVSVPEELFRRVAAPSCTEQGKVILRVAGDPIVLHTTNLFGGFCTHGYLTVSQRRSKRASQGPGRRRDHTLLRRSRRGTTSPVRGRTAVVNWMSVGFPRFSAQTPSAQPRPLPRLAPAPTRPDEGE